MFDKRDDIFNEYDEYGVHKGKPNVVFGPVLFGFAILVLIYIFH